MHTPSPAALALLKRFEKGPKGGFAAIPYRCPAGKRTIGWGHVIQPDDQFPIPMTAAQADDLLRTDLAEFAHVVAQAVKVPLTQSMFDALACLAFNIGPSNFLGSTLLATLNRREYIVAADEFLRWNKARSRRTGKLETLAGLTERRRAERTLFLADGLPKATQ